MSNTRAGNTSELQTLNRVLRSLNETLELEAGLTTALEQVISLLDLQSGWIFVHNSLLTRSGKQDGFTLAAHNNLPRQMHPDNLATWDKDCTCQKNFLEGQFTKACSEVHCSRMASLELGPHDRIHASIPLRSGDADLGIMNLTASEWQPIKPEKLPLLENLGHQIGNFLDRVRLHNLLQKQRLSEMEALLDVSRQLLSRSDPAELADYIVGEVRSLLECDACALLLPNSSGSLEFRAASGWIHNPVEDRRSIPNDQRTGPGLAMLSQEALVIEDLKETTTAAWSEPWIEREGLRGHAIVPLILEERSIGTLVINHRTPRRFQADELRLLQLMANQVAIALEKARLLLETVEKHRMDQELKLAHTIQQNMLPRHCPSRPDWQFAAAYLPARDIGGDFYDFYEFPTEPDLLGIVIADVTDKGVPAALFMASCRTILRSIAFSGREPAATLARANDLILRDSETDTFISAFYALADTSTGRVRYASAGHNPPLLVRPSERSITTLDARGIVLGVVEIAQFEQKTARMLPGDVLVFFTDGVTDAINSTEIMYGMEHLQECLHSCADQDADRIVESILQHIEEHAGSAPRTDDMTLVVVRYAPAG